MRPDKGVMEVGGAYNIERSLLLLPPSLTEHRLDAGAQQPHVGRELHLVRQLAGLDRE